MSGPLSVPGQAGVVAFLSATGGTGRTSAVANLAWVLSSAGKRVLVVDWGSEVPRVREYLEPFLVDRRPFPTQLGRGLLAAYTSTPVRDGYEPTAERFALPDAAGHIDVIAPMEPDAAGRFFPDFQHGDPSAMTDLRTRLTEADYDHVLIDAPTGAGEASLTLIATLCEVAVVCFRPRPRAISDAADLAARLRRRAPVRIDLVPVATLFDDADELSRAQRIRSAIHAAFAELLAGQSRRLPDDGSIEIPYRPYDAFDPLLAILVEEPRPGGTLEHQYGRLASAVTGGEVTGVVQVSPTLRARYRRVFGLDSTVEPDRVLVAYAPPDRAWADWVRGQLDRAGAQTRSLTDAGSWPDAVHPPGLVVISSPNLDGSATQTAVEEYARTHRSTVLRLLLTDTEIAPEDVANTVSVSDQHHESVRARLLTHFGLIDRPGTVQDVGMRVPGAVPAVFGLPPRHPLFVGRDADLEELRDRLSEAGDSRVVVTLGGVPGIGKSELALEYAYRFASDYDLVWWLPSQDRQSVLVSLANLAARLRQPGSTDFGTTSALERLAGDPAYQRFLLVYDNADDLAVLDELLPGGVTGHVLVTSGNAPTTAIELVPMSAGDSARLLADRVPGLSPEDSEQVAVAAGHLPLALDLAGAWLEETAHTEREAGSTVADSAAWAVRTFLAHLDGHQLDGQGDTTARVLAVVTGTLRDTPTGRMAVLLAQLCSFLSPQGVDLGLIRSPALLARLVVAGGGDAEPLRLDAGEIDRVLWTGARFGLFRVDWGDQYTLRLHRVVQNALREGMGELEREARRAEVLSCLAAYAPSEVELTAPDRAARFTELQTHVYPSGALDSDDDQVRRWLVNQVRFLYTDGGTGVRRSALDPGEKLLETWTSRYGTGDPLRARLATQLANIHRVLGNPLQALRLDDTALAQQRRSLQLSHPQTLITARGRGGDLRGLGLFDEALVEDQSTWEGFRRALGEDHPHTRSAANNLAISMFLSGDPAGALELEEDNYRRRRRLFGERDPDTWFSLSRIGVYQRELGDYPNALAALMTAMQKLQTLRSELNPMQLTARWNHAIALRRAGSARDAKARNGKTLRDFREIFGPNHPDTLACSLSFAADHRTVGGDPALAVELASGALRGFLTEVGLAEQHPYVGLCRLGLGLSLRAAGDPDAAIREVQAAQEVLCARLGETHPWTLAADVDLARVVYASGDVPRAVELISTAHSDCVEFLGSEHPFTVIAAHDVRLARQAGDPEQVWREIDVDVPQTS
ncbi:MAG TPA: FxSxx-COOH system tetratricopeptide repeat protein [Umezawaea sp.]|nr:FxSxx-COOH system tetratricopeptide repeat protein [Umezawaea sp.]